MDEVYTIKDVSDALQVAYLTVYWLVRHGKIKAIKIGTQWRITKVEYERILNEGVKDGIA
jgi:excisionase family DNA binding protein